MKSGWGSQSDFLPWNLNEDTLEKLPGEASRRPRKRSSHLNYGGEMYTLLLREEIKLVGSLDMSVLLEMVTPES